MIEAIEPQAKLHVEGDDARMDSRYVQAELYWLAGSLTVYSMLKDERVARDEERSLFNIRDVSDRMG